MAQPKLKKKGMSLSARSAWTAQIFILPFYLGFIFFFLYPLIESIIMSFSTVSLLKNGQTGYNIVNCGFKNYHDAFFVDADFSTNIGTTFVNMLWQVPVIIVLSLFLAIIINQKFKGRTFVRAVFFLPVIFASGVVLTIINGDSVASGALSGSSVSSSDIVQSTALRDLLVNAGLGSQVVDIATNISDNLFSMVWRSGIQMIIFLAGLQGISPALYEASSIEGATSWENFWKITLPCLLPSIMINLVYTIIDTFTDSENAIMMQVSNMMSDSISKLGLSSAFAWSYFVVIGVILVVVLFFFNLVNKKFN